MLEPFSRAGDTGKYGAAPFTLETFAGLIEISKIDRFPRRAQSFAI
jgi:hypothetical protein